MNTEDALLALKDCRQGIDEVDRRIIDLLNERTRIVEKIGNIKRQASLPVYEPRREDQVFLNISTHNKGPLSAGAAQRVFERIIDEMRRIQKERMEHESC